MEKVKITSASQKPTGLWASMQDPRLTFAARGLLYLLLDSDGKDVSFVDVVSRCANSFTEIENALRLLSDCGYTEHRRTPDGWLLVVKAAPAHIRPVELPGLDDGFEEFWQAYPKNRRTGKGDAVKAWAKMKCYLKREEIMQSLEQHKTCDQWLKGFIPLPATWIRQTRWEDEVVVRRNTHRL